MFSPFFHRVCAHVGPGWLYCTHIGTRHLSVSQTTTALRPFYFAVHPDFFGNLPKERLVNENSLKQLNQYVTSLLSGTPVRPIHVNFYIRATDDGIQKGDLRDIRISLASRNIRSTVTEILRSCDLPLDYLDTLPEKQSTTDASRHPLDLRDVSFYTFVSKTRRKNEEKKAKTEKSLRSWLESRSEKVEKYNAASIRTQQQIDKLCLKVIDKIGMKSIRWETKWGNSQNMGCLRTFYQLCKDQPLQMQTALSGRTVVFGNKTGINLHGEVVLSSEDVPTTWIRLLSIIKAYDPILERIPTLQQNLSMLLNRIQIVQLHKQETVLAQTYEELLNRILNMMRRNQDLVTTILCREDLSHLVMVIENASGPLTLTPGGQFLVPATIPGSMLFKFIKENKEDAANRLVDIKIHKFAMNEVLRRCYKELGVASLTYNAAVTPQQMTDCCQRLLDNKADVGHYLTGKRVNVSTYCTVMRDGEITIPWNWA